MRSFIMDKFNVVPPSVFDHWLPHGIDVYRSRGYWKILYCFMDPCRFHLGTQAIALHHCQNGNVFTGLYQHSRCQCASTVMWRISLHGLGLRRFVLNLLSVVHSVLILQDLRDHFSVSCVLLIDWLHQVILGVESISSQVVKTLGRLF